jgi:hypothetical protein
VLFRAFDMFMCIGVDLLNMQVTVCVKRCDGLMLAFGAIFRVFSCEAI